MKQKRQKQWKIRVSTQGASSKLQKRRKKKKKKRGRCFNAYCRESNHGHAFRVRTGPSGVCPASRTGLVLPLHHAAIYHQLLGDWTSQPCAYIPPYLFEELLRWRSDQKRLGNNREVTTYSSHTRFMGPELRRHIYSRNFHSSWICKHRRLEVESEREKVGSIRRLTGDSNVAQC